jgi:drug/metabolite transporter (DMT)-like permease
MPANMFLTSRQFRRSSVLNVSVGSARRASHHRPSILIEPLLAVALWAGTFTAAKLGFQTIPVLTFTGIRLVLAGAVLLVLVGGFKWLRDAQAAWRPLLKAALAQTAFQVLFLQGLQHTTASTSAILLATAPLVGGVWLALRGEQPLQRRSWAGLLIGLAGVTLVVRPQGIGEQSWYGNLVALGAAFAWAWYSLVIGPASHAVGPLRASGFSILVAAVVLAPTWLWEGISLDWSHVSLVSWGAVVYTATFGLVIATALWVRSIQRWGAASTIVYSYLEPVGGVLIAGWLLGETLSPLQAIGGLLALLGVWMASSSAQSN